MAEVALAHRAVLIVGGAEAGEFLQRLVTADLEALDPKSAMPCALLSPQGKVLHEFLVSRAGGSSGGEDPSSASDPSGEAYRLDASRAFLPDLARRLMMYRLHAAVTFEPQLSAPVHAVWNAAGQGEGTGFYRDARFREPTMRNYAAGAEARTGAVAAGTEADALGAWTRHRIEAGVAEIGTDFPADTYFPHDLGLSSNGGVATAKGCYVGQEVVSRMHHRGTGRRRVAILHSDEPLPDPGTPVLVDGRTIGTLGSSTEASPHRAIAIIRIDRVQEAVAAGTTVTTGNVAVRVHAPPGAGWSPDVAGEKHGTGPNTEPNEAGVPALDASQSAAR